MYAKIIKNNIVDIAKIEKEGFTYLAIDYNAFINNKAKGLYKVTPYGIPLKDNRPIMNKVFKAEDKVVPVDKKETIEDKLERVKKQFEKNIDTNVKYKNGQYYKPRYASENYEPLLAANKILELETQGQKSLFPKEIWDATKLNSAVMTAAELQELALYLAKIYEVQFQQYKKACAKILNSGDK